MDDTRKRILKATYKAVRKYGLDGLRIQNISEQAGLSPGALYRYFDSKESLLEDAYIEIDQQVARLFERAAIDWDRMREEPLIAIQELWTVYFHFWLARPDETVFFNSFRGCPGFQEFENRPDTGYLTPIFDLSEQLLEFFPAVQRVNRTLLRIHILNASVMYAKCVVEGILPDDEETTNQIFLLLSTGLAGMLAQI